MDRFHDTLRSRIHEQGRRHMPRIDGRNKLLLSDFRNRPDSLRNSLIGALAGGGLGALTAGRGDDDEDPRARRKRRILRALLGAGLGGSAGYGTDWVRAAVKGKNARVAEAIRQAKRRKNIIRGTAATAAALPFLYAGYNIGAPALRGAIRVSDKTYNSRLLNSTRVGRLLKRLTRNGLYGDAIAEQARKHGIEHQLSFAGGMGAELQSKMKNAAKKHYDDIYEILGSNPAAKRIVDRIGKEKAIDMLEDFVSGGTNFSSKISPDERKVLLHAFHPVAKTVARPVLNEKGLKELAKLRASNPVVDDFVKRVGLDKAQEYMGNGMGLAELRKSGLGANDLTAIAKLRRLLPVGRSGVEAGWFTTERVANPALAKGTHIGAISDTFMELDDKRTQKKMLESIGLGHLMPTEMSDSQMTAAFGEMLKDQKMLDKMRAGKLTNKDVTDYLATYAAGRTGKYRGIMLKATGPTAGTTPGLNDAGKFEFNDFVTGTPEDLTSWTPEHLTDWFKNRYMVQFKEPVMKREMPKRGLLGRLQRGFQDLDYGGRELPDNLEYRMHVVNGKVVPYATSGKWNILDYFNPFASRRKQRLEDEVQSMVDKLVASPMGQKYDIKNNVFGLDVGVRPDGSPIIFEMNPSQLSIDRSGSGQLLFQHIRNAVNADIKNQMPGAQKIQLGTAAGIGGAGLGLGAYGTNQLGKNRKGKEKKASYDMAMEAEACGRFMSHA